MTLTEIFLPWLAITRSNSRYAALDGLCKSYKDLTESQMCRLIRCTHQLEEKDKELVKLQQMLWGPAKPYESAPPGMIDAGKLMVKVLQTEPASSQLDSPHPSK